MSKTINTITQDETISLLNYLISKNRKTQTIQVRTRNYAMTTFMLEAGLRVGELIKLHLSDIWMDGEPVRTLVVRSAISKNHVEREIPCTDRLRNTITEMFEQIFGPQGLTLNCPVFHTGLKRNAITARQVERIILLASSNSIGRGIYPHVLRHTFATRLMRVTNIRIVQKLLGHKNIGSTQIYTHPNNQDLSEAISKI